MDIWATYFINLVNLNLLKIAQSGHTGLSMASAHFSLMVCALFLFHFLFNSSDHFGDEK